MERVTIGIRAPHAPLTRGDPVRQVRTVSSELCLRTQDSEQVLELPRKSSGRRELVACECVACSWRRCFFGSLSSCPFLLSVPLGGEGEAGS